ncbi:TetR/AcrR family transcriptional regulator [Flammeovirgaceae bacterium SG7u.111]|nr:TetR/AcrR family transcriptional regulator [Flammeovirgaceae bacterium SG7u.132]WPO38628.1 TetR/AcrR family transcriptional regulator [Flammeovirgaceae bacterium SG7u.111]
MKTKELIKDVARESFNQKGIQNVTLREVAASLKKSYGNVTYHFPTKEHLIEELFQDYNSALKELQIDHSGYENLLHYFLVLPEFSFDITVKYLFFFIDYVELKRIYPEFIQKVEEENKGRKEKWKGLMQVLQKQGFLENKLADEDLEYIMELSAGMRMVYFQENLGKQFDTLAFSKKVNQLLLPYLSEQGKRFYEGFYR